MTLPGGGKRTWLLPVVLSLLLHVPIAILLSRLPAASTYSEPALKLSMRSAPAAVQKAGALQRTAGTKEEPQPKPQPKPIQESAVTPRASQKSDSASKSGSLPKNEAAKNEAVGNNTTGNEAAGNAADQRTAGSGPTPGASAASAPPPVSTGPVEVSKLKILKQVVPDYPAFSRKRREEGSVRIIVSIKGGAVLDAEVYESSGHQRLDQSAMRAAKQWRFAEAEELRVIIPFIFNLTD